MIDLGTSLVVQWLRICLPVQRTWIWEDSTCYRSSRPFHHSYWAHSWQLLGLCSRAPCCNCHAREPELPTPACPGARALPQENSPQREAHAPQLESSPRSQQLEKQAQEPCFRFSTVRNKWINNFLNGLEFYLFPFLSVLGLCCCARAFSSCSW